jgi:hypothetical protein
LICLYRDFDERVTGAVAIDLGLDELGNDSKPIRQSMTIDGSKLTGGWYYFQAPRQGNIDLVVVLEDVLEAMAYATPDGATCRPDKLWIIRKGQIQKIAIDLAGKTRVALAQWLSVRGGEASQPLFIALSS